MWTKAQWLVNTFLRIALSQNRFSPVNGLHDKAKLIKSYMWTRFNILKFTHSKIYTANNVEAGCQVNTRLYDGPVLLQILHITGNFKNCLYYSENDME